MFRYLLILAALFSAAGFAGAAPNLPMGLEYSRNVVMRGPWAAVAVDSQGSVYATAGAAVTKYASSELPFGKPLSALRFSLLGLPPTTRATYISLLKIRPDR